MPRKAKRLKPSDQLSLPIPLEKDEQIKLCAWLKRKNIFFFAIPNGGSRNYLEAVALKKSGLLAGVPDLCVPIPSCGHHSLYIELKRRTKYAKVSDEQKEVIGRLNELGHLAVVCYGFDEAKQVVEDYLGNVPCRTQLIKKEAYEQVCLPDFM